MSRETNQRVLIYQKVPMIAASQTLNYKLRLVKPAPPRFPDGLYYSVHQAPGSSCLCLSGENPDLGPQKCNNFGLKSAIRHKACHVVTNVTSFEKKIPQLTVHDISPSEKPVAR